MNFLFVRFSRTPFQFNYRLNDDLDPVFYAIQSLVKNNPLANIYLVHSKKVPLDQSETDFLDHHEVETISFDDLNFKIVSKIDPDNEWLKALNPYEINDKFYNDHNDPDWPNRFGNSIKFKILSMTMEALKLKDLMFIDNDVVTIASFEKLYNAFANTGWPVVMGQNDYNINGGLIFMNNPGGPYSFMQTESIWLSALMTRLKTGSENKSRKNQYYASDEPMGLFISRYYGLNFEDLWRKTGFRFLDIPSILSDIKQDRERALSFTCCKDVIAIHCANHLSGTSKGNIIRSITETASAIGGVGELSLREFVELKAAPPQNPKDYIKSDGGAITERTERSFVFERGIKKNPLCTIYCGVRDRLEARLVTETWSKQTVPVEIIVAEFGEYPTVFHDYNTQKYIDKYIFCYQPDNSPYALCWWRNVAALRSTCKYALQLDADQAIAPNAVEMLLAVANGRKCFVHPKRYRTSDAKINTSDYSLIQKTGATTNCEPIWLFDMDEYRRIGGWAEPFTGKGPEITVFAPRIKDIEIIDFDGDEFFCHVQHEPSLPSLQKQLPQATRHSQPIMPWLRSWSAHEQYCKESGVESWPCQTWTPGKIDLCEDKT